jgi:hypothetical protein
MNYNLRNAPKMTNSTGKFGSGPALYDRFTFVVTPGEISKPISSRV